MRGFIAQPGEQVPGKLGSKGQRHVLGPTRFERCEHRVEGETHVGPHANLAEVWSHISKASIPQLDAALPGAAFRAESGVPEVRRVGLDAQQWE